MEWIINFHNKFEIEFAELTDEIQDKLLSYLNVLKQFGPMLGRPTVDTLIQDLQIILVV